MTGTYNKQRVYLVRHGETEWSLSGRHTGGTDISLTGAGRGAAERLGPVLQRQRFELVLVSPLKRAMETCRLAGFAAEARTDENLREWNYGSYEGRTSADIHAERPDWHLFRDGCPDGESPDQVGERADRVIRRVRAIAGDVLLFSSGHFLRVLVARWLGLPPAAGRYFVLGTASLSKLGYEHDRSEPATLLWNENPYHEHIGLARSQWRREKAQR